MKTIFSIACTLLLVSTATSTPLIQKDQSYISPAAASDNFIRFNAHRQQAGIALSWVFSNPDNAVAFLIERSYDGNIFEPIAEIPTTPGNGNRNQYRDNSVFPGYIYYRVSALMYDGSAISSHVEMVRIVRNG